MHNCIAYAAGDTRRWWWPVWQPNAYWPPGVSRELTLESCEQAFMTLGYQRRLDDSLQSGVEKIAVFISPTKGLTHASRQLVDGSWTSKLGPLEDIRHPLKQVEGDVYGVVAIVMSRPRQP